MLKSNPGYEFKTLIENLGWTDEQSASTLGLTLAEYGDLILGRLRITSALAERMATVSGGEQQFWLDLEHNYRTTLSYLNTWPRVLQKDALGQSVLEVGDVYLMIHLQVNLLKSARYDDFMLNLILATDPDQYPASTLLIMAQEFVCLAPIFGQIVLDFLLKIPTEQLDLTEQGIYQDILNFLQKFL